MIRPEGDAITSKAHIDFVWEGALIPLIVTVRANIDRFGYEKAYNDLVTTFRTNAFNEGLDPVFGALAVIVMRCAAHDCGKEG